MTSPRSWLTAGAVGMAGLAAGAVMATTMTAQAADSATPTPTPGQSATPDQHPPRGERDADEQELTGNTANQVRRAALAEYPGARVVRLTADGEGGYEAHLIQADGSPISVELDKTFTVTGVEEDRGGHGPCGDDGDATGGQDTDDGSATDNT